MLLHDRAPIASINRLPDGRVTAVAKFARTGCYTYTGAEVGRPDLPQVTVYRDEAEVFSEDAMASFAHKAITLDHPTESVSSTNWQRVSVGFTEGRVARDGAYLQIPLMLADASAVAALDNGKRELSAGYSCDLVWGDGVAPDGTRFQARQTNVRGNHIALVAAGRAGSECRIGDAAPASINFTDADQAVVIARAAMMHRTRTGYLGDQAPPFTEAMAQAAVAAARTSAAQVRDSAASFTDAAERERIKAQEARREMIDRLTNAHRN